MSHGITQMANGDFSFVRIAGSEAAWHGLGQEYNGELNIHAFAKAGYCDFPTELAQCKICLPGSPLDGNSIPERYIVRMDSHKILGIVGHEYQLVQNSEVWSYLQKWVDAGLGTLETCGSLFGGLKNFVTLKMKLDPIDVGGDGTDTLDSYLMTMNPYDGLSAIYQGFTEIRPVCNNTVTAAIASTASAMLRVKHRGDMEFKLEKANDTLRMAHEDRKKNAEVFQWLATKPVVDEQLGYYVRKLFGYDLKKPMGDLPKRSQTKINEVFNVMNTHAGQNLDSTKHTWWWAYQGINGYLNHADGRTQQGRFDKLYFGANRALDQEALTLAISAANGNNLAA